MLAKTKEAGWMGDVTRVTIIASFKVQVAGSNFCDVFRSFFTHLEVEGVLLALTWLVSASCLVFYAERDQCRILLETVVSVFKAISSGAEEIAAWTRAIPLWTFSPPTPWSLWLLWAPVLTINHTLLKLVSVQNQAILKGLVISLVLPLRHTGHILRFLWENTGSQGDSS